MFYEQSCVIATVARTVFPSHNVLRNSVSRSCFVASSVYREDDVSRKNTEVQLNGGLNHQEAYSACHPSRESDEKYMRIIMLFSCLLFLDFWNK